MNRHKMAYFHLSAGIVFLLLIAVAGIIMKLITVQIGVVIALVILILSPIMFRLVGKVRKHDDNIHYHDHDVRLK